MPAACPVCEARKRSHLCPACINAQLFDAKKSELKQQRDELQQQLEAALEKRVRLRAALWRRVQRAAAPPALPRCLATVP
jgi:erythromycin esterase-like protein